MIFKVLTLGCKTNQAESTQIERNLCEAGHKIAGYNEKPDICIINTCSVTIKADQQSRQLIKKYLNNDVKVIVTGCYSELNYEKLKDTKLKLEIIRNKDKDKILNLFTNNKTEIKHYQYSRQRPAVKIQDGCNNSCSYCVIPLTRGKSKSISPEEVIKEIYYYESSGFKEIVLTGIHLGDYGADVTPKSSLPSLLKYILIKTKNLRIRLSSIEMKEINEELLEVFSEPRICKHLHIPLQSGDNKILNLMNRKYKIEDYVSKVKKLLYRFNNICLGTDVIVGFPGERDIEFKNSKLIVEEIPFSYLHVFTFSPRPQTIATSFKNQIDDKTKRLRSEILRSIGEAKRTDFIHKNIGKIKQVIIENEINKGFTGTSEDYIKILVAKNDCLKTGMLIDVKLDAHKNGVVTGLPLF